MVRDLGVCLAAAGCWAATLSGAMSAVGDEPTEESSLRWDEAWPRVRVAEYVATGTMIGATAVGLFALPQTEDAWQGGILFDEALRERLVLGNRADRSTAVSVGDVFFYGLSAYPFVADVGVAALAVHQSSDVAWQMFVIDVQAFALTGLISTYTQKLVGRDRPFLDRCDDDPGYDPDCADAGVRSQSFLSGHTSMAFTGAGLICVHHIRLDLYGGGAPDVLACSLGTLGATMVGMSRVVADRHHASDVLAGASLGFLSGYLLPELLHYHFGAAASADARDEAGIRWTAYPFASRDAIGLGVTGLND